MNKKIVFALAAMLAVSILFTACGKKDEENKKPAQNQSGEVKADDNTEDEIKLEEEKIDSQPAQDSTPISDEKGEPITADEFESLVDTFNNSENPEEKEAARLKLEEILKQAEGKAN